METAEVSLKLPCHNTYSKPFFFYFPHSQANLDEDTKEKSQDALGKLAHKGGKMESETEKSDSEASAKEEQDGACMARYTPETKVRLGAALHPLSSCMESLYSPIGCLTG
jgi:hypothetical protein